MNCSVTCECGIVYPVSLTDAGLPIDCKCGKSFYIPSLSKLRESVGESPIPLNTVETIQAMIHNGSLPSRDDCPYSSRPANETVFFRVQCEVPWSGESKPTHLQKVLLTMIFGWFGNLFIFLKSQETMECGRDTSIEVPLQISSDFRDKILRIRNQSKLKALLSKTPIYARLLKEFPDATIETLPSSTIHSIP